jgi:hypothetical protein
MDSFPQVRLSIVSAYRLEIQRRARVRLEFLGYAERTPSLISPYTGKQGDGHRTLPAVACMPLLSLARSGLGFFIADSASFNHELSI